MREPASAIRIILLQPGSACVWNFSSQGVSILETCRMTFCKKICKRLDPYSSFSVFLTELYVFNKIPSPDVSTRKIIENIYIKTTKTPKFLEMCSSNLLSLILTSISNFSSLAAERQIICRAPSLDTFVNIICSKVKHDLYLVIYFIYSLF